MNQAADLANRLIAIPSVTPATGPVFEVLGSMLSPLGFEVHRTAAIVAAKLRDFGCDEVVEGIGRTGVVGVIKGKTDTSGRVIGLRADMDALPIIEQTGVPYASKTPGKMHACGHDGHVAMLLAAAQHFAKQRLFDGTVYLIFQPAEEGRGGARRMVEDGLFRQFPCDAVYGLHNMPGLDPDEIVHFSPPDLAGLGIPEAAQAVRDWLRLADRNDHNREFEIRILLNLHA